MATFSIMVRVKRKDGFYPVYIRVVHKSCTAYIKTSFLVPERGVKKTYMKSGKGHLEIGDAKILRECMNEIAGYVRRLNDINSDAMSVQEIVKFLQKGEGDILFTDFAGKDKLSFNDMTFALLPGWIDSMMDSSRKRNLYSTCIPLDSHREPCR